MVRTYCSLIFLKLCSKYALSCRHTNLVKLVGVALSIFYIFIIFSTDCPTEVKEYNSKSNMQTGNYGCTIPWVIQNPPYT